MSEELCQKIIEKANSLLELHEEKTDEDLLDLEEDEIKGGNNLLDDFLGDFLNPSEEESDEEEGDFFWIIDRENYDANQANNGAIFGNFKELVSDDSDDDDYDSDGDDDEYIPFQKPNNEDWLKQRQERDYQLDRRQNFDIDLEDAEEQKKIMEIIQKKRMEKISEEEKMRMLKRMEDELEIEQQTREELDQKPKYKTGFGMYFVRWCLNNTGFEFFHTAYGYPMNKIDFFYENVWKALSELDRNRWRTRAFNKNHGLEDPEEKKELEKLRAEREKKRKAEEDRLKKKQKKLRSGCACGHCY